VADWYQSTYYFGGGYIDAMNDTARMFADELDTDKLEGL